MISGQKILIGMAMLVVGSAALAQDTMGPLPDPSHIPFFLPQNIKWQTGGEQAGQRSEVYPLFGDVNKPGPYAVLLKWLPGNMSRPHFHGKTRYITVISGHWWVSSSNVFDPNKTYPLPPGTIVQDVANTVHWDGAKNEPVILEIVGDGPAPNISVDEKGKPLPHQSGSK
jgi:quercetin dioxygenase-like cupin family protein